MASSTVFVSNFPFATTEDELRALFDERGSVRSVRIIVDRDSGRSRGFAFVELADPATVDGAIEGLDGMDFHGRRLAVSKARGRGAEARPTRPPGRGEEDAASSALRGEPLRHRIVIDWSDETGAYCASVPDLGISVQAPTLEAATRAIQAQAARPPSEGEPTH